MEQWVVYVVDSVPDLAGPSLLGHAMLTLDTVDLRPECRLPREVKHAGIIKPAQAATGGARTGCPQTLDLSRRRARASCILRSSSTLLLRESKLSHTTLHRPLIVALAEQLTAQLHSQPQENHAERERVRWQPLRTSQSKMQAWGIK